MTENLSEFAAACRFCLETKFKTILLSNFHIMCFEKLTGELLTDHHSLPMTICMMCNREISRFYDFRERLKEKQEKLKDLLQKSENLVEIDSMAEKVPTNDDDDLSNFSDSTISQCEVDEEIMNGIEEKPIKNPSKRKKSFKKLDPSKREVIRKSSPIIVRQSSKDKRLIVVNDKGKSKRLKGIFENTICNGLKAEKCNQT